MLIKLGIFLFGLTIAESLKHFYRKDYRYFEEYDAFYKIHVSNESSYESAFMTCDDEGSQLFYPKVKSEWAVAKILRAKLDEPLQSNATEILVGIHDEIGRGEFITVDGHSTPSPLENLNSGQDCVVMDMETGTMETASCTQTRPFVCKKVDDKPCPTIDRGYQFSKVTKKCYKINRKLKKWAEAMHTCFMEGGMLAVIENDAEANVISDMLEASRSGSREHFVGFRRVYPRRDFYTIKGQKLDDVFQRWNNDPSESIDCGTAYRYNNNDILYISTGECQANSPFICEMAANSI